MITTIEVPVGTSALNITQESDRILFEFVPKFKEGNFLYFEAYGQETTLIFKKIYNNRLYYYASLEEGDYLDFCEINYWENIHAFRLATEEEKQQLLHMMEKDGKQWNAEKLRVEDIPQRKFKPGDKVKLKDGMLDKGWENPYFVEDMHVFIDKVLTVGRYTPKGYIYMNESDDWAFAEDWLELYSDEPIVGELAIFWDSCKEHSSIRLYTGNITPPRANQRVYLSTRRVVDNQVVGEWTDPVLISGIDGQSGEDGVDIEFIHRDHLGVFWANAIKFISREQFDKHIKG